MITARTFFALAACIVLAPFTLNAQIIDTDEEIPGDSVNFAFLPALAYNSDFGFVAGGITSWYIYKNDIHPFHSYINFSGLISTKGLASFQIFYDKPKVFGSNYRTTNEVYISRFLQDTYFGIGEYNTIEGPPEGLPDYYLYTSISAGYENIFRIPVYQNGQKQLDISSIIDVDYKTPWNNGNDRLIAVEQPLGYEGSQTLLVGLGVIWEGRNNEFRPRTGNFIQTSVKVGQKFWGSSYNNLFITYDMRHYVTFHLIRDITWANRIMLRHSRGEVPYWKLSYAGDEETLRGYGARRFLDDNLALFNTELRTWLFSISEIDARFGGTLFFDAGRTFANGTPLSEVTGDLKYAYGFGGTASFFTPDFIIRGDFGFSEEDLGIYFTIGYMF